MCYQINYTFACEHVRTHIVYCADAPPAPTASESSSSSSGSRPERRGKGSRGSKSRGGSSSGTTTTTTTSKQQQQQQQQSRADGHSGTGASSTTATARRPCRRLTQQSLPYPTPPSFAGSPAAAAASPLLPKCPLERCPFEERNRCWNCCWCGKQWNDTGRCRCVMIIEGNQVQCEHICCGNCTAA